MTATRALPVVVTLAVLASCGASSPETAPTTLFGKPIPTTCSSDAHDSSDSRRCVAWLVDQLVTSSYGSYPDPPLTAYVSSVGARITAVADPEGRVGSWTFRVLDDPDVRAYAQLAGHVYVSRGALAVLGSEAELAALLAHEIAHVVAGHGDVFWQRLVLDIDTSADEVAHFARERDDERQADELAVSYLLATDYDASAMLDMLSSIHGADLFERAQAGVDVDNQDPAPSWRHSHPPLEVRLARAALALGSRDGGVQRFRQRYLEHIDQLVLGPDPRLGQLEAGTYVHVRGKLAVATGASWAVAMVGRELRGVHSGGELKMALIPIGDLYAAGIDAELGEASEVRLGGFEARVGWYSGDDDASKGAVRRIAIIRTDTSMFTLGVQGPTRPGVERAFAALAGQLRPPRRDEMTAMPMRIALVEVKRRGTVGALAARCKRSDITVMLEGGDARSRRDRGDRLKCTE